MKVIVKKTVLAEMVEKAQGCLSCQAVTDNLRYYYLSAQGSALTIRSADIDIMYQGVVEQITVEAEGELCLPAAKMNDIVRLSIDTVTIDQESGGFLTTILSKNASWKIQGRDPHDFPPMPDYRKDIETAVEVPLDSLLKGLKSVKHAVTTEETRANMLMVNINEAGMFATDGKRVAIFRVEGLPPVRIPSPAIDELIRLLSMSSAKMVKVKDGEGNIAFGIGSDVFVSRQLTAKFVDLTKVLKKVEEESVNGLELAKADVVRAVEQAGITVGKKGVLDIKIGNGEVVFLTTDELGNSGSMKIPMSPGGVAKNVSIDYRFIVDALKVIEGDKVTVQYPNEGSLTAVSFRGGKVNCLILPMRM